MSLEVLGSKFLGSKLLEVPGPGFPSSSPLRSKRCASRAPNRAAAQFHTDFAVRRGQQGRAPQQSSDRRRLHQVTPPAKTSTGFSREFSSAISGFHSLYGRKQRSSLSHRARLDLAFWNLSLGAGSRSENSGLHPQYPQEGIPNRASTGPATLDRCRERNVVGPGEYSKRFFCIQSGFIGAIS